MKLQFELTMPNNNSWNGVDTGNTGGHFIYRDVDKRKADELIDKSFYYNFDDGWGANVAISKHRKQKSNGFRGYDWMVDEIIEFGKIFCVQDRRMKGSFEKEFKDKMKAFFESPEYTKTDIRFLTKGVFGCIANFHFKNNVGI